MNIQLINERDTSLSALEQIFINRGLTLDDIPLYTGDQTVNIISHHKLKNIERAVEVFLKHYEKNDRMMIQADVDVDGYTSAALLYNYIKANYPKADITVQVHDEKIHGLELRPEVLDGTYQLIFVPDAGSSEFDKHKIVYDLGIDLIMLDHHETPHDSEHAIVVNNQLSDDYSNKSLSGVGIVYKFCRLLDEDQEHGEHIRTANSYLDLVALGNIADMSSFLYPETASLISYGLSMLNSRHEDCNIMLGYMIEKQSFSLGKTVTPTGISWYIAPFINAVIRSGTREEKEFIFSCFLDEKAVTKVQSKKRGSKAGDMEYAFIEGMRMLTNIKNRQKGEVDPVVDKLKSTITPDYLTENQVIVLEPPSGTNRNIYGLVANKIMAEYQRPVLVVKETKGTKKDENDEDVIETPSFFSGSARAPQTEKLESFREYIEDTGIANYASGHGAAFGVSYNSDKKNALIENFNTNLNFTNIEKIHKVDFLYNKRTIDPIEILDIAKWESLWGQGLDVPLFAFELELESKDVVLMGAKKNTIKILVNGVGLIKFRTSEEEYLDLMPSDTNKVKIVQVVGEAKINEWNGTISPQIFIKDMEIVGEKYSF